MRINRLLGTVLLLVLFWREGMSQQMRLGSNPFGNTKSAVLELQSANQGLLFSRLADTALINALNPPDGMVVFYTPSKTLLVRAHGHWQSLASATSIDTTNISGFSQKVRSRFSAGAGISYNSTTGIISNTGVTAVNGNTGALTLDTGYISNFYQKVRGLFGASGPVTLNNGQIGLTQATTSTNGYLSSTDWNTFNNKLSSVDTSDIANFYQKVRGLFSAGSGISYSATTGVITATGGAGTGWAFNGNTVGLLKTIGTVDNYSLPFITNNAERMRISNTGSVGIGASAFDVANPEKLLVNAGATSSVNVISGKGSINNYLQLNIQNQSNGATASSDVVATADNGSETTNFVDMGINSSGFSNTGILGGANNAYLYSMANDFVIGNATGNKNLMFFTGGNATTNERMRIDQYGRVGIGVTNAANPLVIKDTFEIRRTGSLSTLLFSNTSGSGDFRIGSDGGDLFWQGGGSRNLQMGSYWTTVLMGDRQSGSFPAMSTGTATNTGVLIPSQRIASVPLAVQATTGQTAHLTEWRGSTGTVQDVIDAAGRMAIGTGMFDETAPEQLLVDAGVTDSYNLMVAKGNRNGYLQFNIQNESGQGQASTDIVATANNGTETTNYVNLGINGGGYNSASNILSGPNNGYLYSAGQDFVVGNTAASKNFILFTGGIATTNERMRITSTGRVGVATTAPAATLDVAGTYKLGSSGTALNNMIKTTFSITDNTAFGIGQTRVVTASVSGATPNATVILNPRSALPTSVAIAYSYVSSANTITIGFTAAAELLGTRTLGTINFDVTLIQ